MEKINVLYEEALKIAEQLSLTDEVINGMKPPPYEDAFCCALGAEMFMLNDEKDPSTELVTDKLTPEMIDWYYRQLEWMCGQ